MLSGQKYKLGRNIKDDAGKRFPIQGDKEKIRPLKVNWDIKSEAQTQILLLATVLGRFGQEGGTDLKNLCFLLEER